MKNGGHASGWEGGQAKTAQAKAERWGREHLLRCPCVKPAQLGRRLGGDRFPCEMALSPCLGGFPAPPAWARAHDRLLLQFGRTEVIDNTLNPDFVRKFIVDYFFEEKQNLRFDL